MDIRFYKISDYQKLISLYEKSDQFEFDEVTDAEEALERKVEKDPESILTAEEDGKIVGSVSIIEDGRVALLFRLVAEDNRQDILEALVKKAEEILKSRGYKEVHNTAPAGDQKAVEERKKLGFNKGKDYSWFWKKID